jgi:predicted DNA-binding protein with PD1-like motif
MTYAMPALSPSPDYAAYYSEFFRPPGRNAIESSAATFGLTGGAPSLHCHAVWREPDGTRHGGHVIPTETFIADPVRAHAWALDGMGFEARPDPETNFTLFGPIQQPLVQDGRAGGRFFALRLRPNQDICGALEAFCCERRIGRAQIRGGVASIIGAVFEDGRVVEPFATEMLIRSGRIAAARDGTLEASLDVALVDYTGVLSEGRLRRGANPVLMTVEVALEAIE